MPNKATIEEAKTLKQAYLAIREEDAQQEKCVRFQVD